MKTAALIQIGKEIIYLAGYYSNYKPSIKNRLEKKLFSYKNELQASANPYAEKLIHFCDDLLTDLKNNRPLQLDHIYEDDFIGNYYFSKKQVGHYNNLFSEADKNSILEASDKQDALTAVYENFFKHYKELDSDFISSRFPIFMMFERESVLKNLHYIHALAIDTTHTRAMLQAYTDFTKKIKRAALGNIKNKNIHSKYIEIKTDEMQNWSDLQVLDVFEKEPYPALSYAIMTGVNLSKIKYR